MIKYFFAFSLLVSLNIKCADKVKEKEDRELREILVQAPGQAIERQEQLRQRNVDSELVEELRNTNKALSQMNDSQGCMFVNRTISNLGLIAFTVSLVRCCLLK